MLLIIRAFCAFVVHFMSQVGCSRFSSVKFHELSVTYLLGDTKVKLYTSILLATDLDYFANSATLQLNQIPQPFQVARAMSMDPYVHGPHNIIYTN